MKILYIGIIRNGPKYETVELAFERDLSSFSRFTRDKYGEFMSMFAKTVAKRTKPRDRKDIEEQSHTFHAYGFPKDRKGEGEGEDEDEGIVGLIISDAEYPALVAHHLLSKIVNEFTTQNPVSSYSDSSVTSLPMPSLKQYIVKYQDPAQADSIMRVQQELDETKIVLHKTIESVLERGEKIDTLVAKSDGLSAQSKMFYQQARKQNSCCVVM